MCCPEHVVALLNLVNGPKKLSFEDHDFNIKRVTLKTSVYLCKGKLLISCSDIRESSKLFFITACLFTWGRWTWRRLNWSATPNSKHHCSNLPRWGSDLSWSIAALASLPTLWPVWAEELSWSLIWLMRNRRAWCRSLLSQHRPRGLYHFSLLHVILLFLS
jgi:hypothetical protein